MCMCSLCVCMCVCMQVNFKCEPFWHDHFLNSVLCLCIIFPDMWMTGLNVNIANSLVNEWMHVFAAFPDYVPVMQQFACSLRDAVPVYSTVAIYRDFCSPLKKIFAMIYCWKTKWKQKSSTSFFFLFFFSPPFLSLLSKLQAEFALCYTCLPIYLLFTWTFVYHTDRDRINRVFLFVFIAGAEDSLQACVTFESFEGRHFLLCCFWCFYDLNKPSTYCVKPSESTGSKGSHPERVN